MLFRQQIKCDQGIRNLGTVERDAIRPKTRLATRQYQAVVAGERGTSPGTVRHTFKNYPPLPYSSRRIELNSSKSKITIDTSRYWRAYLLRRDGHSCLGFHLRLRLRRRVRGVGGHPLPSSLFYFDGRRDGWGETGRAARLPFPAIVLEEFPVAWSRSSSALTATWTPKERHGPVGIASSSTFG